MGDERRQVVPHAPAARYAVLAKFLLSLGVVISILTGVGMLSGVSVWSLAFLLAAMFLQSAWLMSFLTAIAKVVSQRAGLNRRDSQTSGVVLVHCRLGIGLALVSLVVVATLSSAIPWSDLGRAELPSTLFLVHGVIAALQILCVMLGTSTFASLVSRQPAVIKQMEMPSPQHVPPECEQSLEEQIRYY